MKADHKAVVPVHGPNMVVSYPVVSAMLLDEARELLNTQPDFVEQKKHNWIAETVEAYGHIAIFGPKFHPELAPIELFWAEMKRYLRHHCDYTLPTLKANIPLAIASVPVETFRRHFAHVARYMKAYATNTFSLEQIEWAMRKYTSHRRAVDPLPDLDARFLGADWFTDMPERMKMGPLS